MALIEKLQSLAAFEDVDIGASAQHLGHHEQGHNLQMRFAKAEFSVRSVHRTNHLSYHNMVPIWSRPILERSCHLQSRSVMHTKYAKISMKPSLMNAWGKVVLPSQKPSRGSSLNVRKTHVWNKEQGPSQCTLTNSLSCVHCFHVASDPARFRLGETL